MTLPALCITRIVRKNGDMILISAEDWESIEETLYLTNQAGAIERIIGADNYQPLQELSTESLIPLLATSE